MLTAIYLGNFKSFAETQRVPIRPLTLIYGANSAGKSSIIHTLLLARHAMDKGDMDVYRTEVGGDSVDLGGFRQYVHRRDIQCRVEWAAEIDVSSLSTPLSENLALPSHKVSLTKVQIYKMKNRLDELLAPAKKVLMSVTIGVQLDDKGHQIRGTVPEIISCEIEADGNVLIRMSRRPDGNLGLNYLDHEQPIFRQILKAIVEASTTSESIHPADFEGLSEAIARIVPDIRVHIGKFLPAGLTSLDEVSSTGEDVALFPISRGRRREDLAAAVGFFLPRMLDELIGGLSSAIAAELSRIHYLGPLRSYPPRHLAFAQYHDPNWYAGGGYTWDVIRHDSDVRSAVNKWLCAPERLQTPYELVIQELIAIDQMEESLLEGIEKMAEEGLDIESEQDSEYTIGGAWPVIKDPEAEAKRLHEKILSSDIDRLKELILIDRRSNTPVSHRDIGVGISQVLPVLISAYAHEKKIIAIEQPEIHLHPAIQSDLADVFIESALGEKRNTFIIETHSEHLLLRIMRRMRETAKNQKKIPYDVTPKDVMVLFVERVDGKAIVREIPLNEHGELVKAWPGGFFEEGFREVFSD